jgi:hypothetical protein
MFVRDLKKSFVKKTQKSFKFFKHHFLMISNSVMDNYSVVFQLDKLARFIVVENSVVKKVNFLLSMCKMLF